eukprot:5897784-Amphidinium_carterae.1
MISGGVAEQQETRAQQRYCEGGPLKIVSGRDCPIATLSKLEACFSVVVSEDTSKSQDHHIFGLWLDSLMSRLLPKAFSLTSCLQMVLLQNDQSQQ